MGFGLYVLSVIAALLLLVTLLVLGWVRSLVPVMRSAVVRVRAVAGLDCVEKFEALLRGHEMHISSVRFSRAKTRGPDGEPGGDPVVLERESNTWTTRI